MSFITGQLKTILGCGASLGVLLAMQPAGAQLAPQAQAATANAAGADSASSPGGLEEIVVTAQRREERNQTVPISITAFSPKFMEKQNISSGQGLNGQVPSLLVSVAGEPSREVEAYTLRGVGLTNFGSSGVVVYLADVPLPEGYAANFQGGPGNYVDLENVQVLKGPQGTLFGRNTTGGAVLLVPHKPTNDYEGYLQVSTGNYSYVGVEGALNVPIVPDKLLFRVSGTFQKRDGYTHEILWNKYADDMDYNAGRAAVTFRPTDGIENYLMVYGSYSSNNGTSHINQGVLLPVLEGLGACTAPCTAYVNAANLQKKLGPFASMEDVDQFTKIRTWGIINKTRVDLTDEITINNIVSYQRFTDNYGSDNDGLPFEMTDLGGLLPSFPVPGIAPHGYGTSVASGPKDDLKEVTEELQLQGKLLDEHLTYTVGGFYYDKSPNGPQTIADYLSCPAAATGACPAALQAQAVSNESKAVYVQGALDLGEFTPALDGLRLTAGYRYTHDTISGNSVFYIPFAPSVLYCITSAQIVSSVGNCGYSATLKSYASTWTFGLDYKLDSNVLVYGKVSRGYKAGGFNPYAVRVSTETFNPEVVTSYEIGMKSDWVVGTVPARVNLAAYDTEYPNKQIAIGDSSNGAQGAAILPSDATIRGVELETSIKPIPALEIGGNASYTDAFYNKYSFIAQAPTLGCNGPVPTGGSVDASCEPYGVSKWIWNIHASLDVPVPETWGTVNLYANYAHISKNPQAPTEPGGIYQAYGLLNLSLNWEKIAQTNFDMQLFATNVTNELYRISNSNTSGSGFYSSVYGEPQMYGVRFKYRFHEAASEPEATPAVYVPPPARPVAPAPRSYLVFFDFNKSDLTPQAQQIVDQAASNAGPAHVMELTVTGHTDTVGSDAYNMRLSRRRAESVAARLEKDGIPSSEIAIVAKGKRDLLVPTADGVREPQNRRVQIVYDNGAAS